MKIAAVIVTHNRLELLPRALKSVKSQSRPPDFVYIISNSTKDNLLFEVKTCADFGYRIIQNYRTNNCAGAFNVAIEELVKENGVSEDLYFASLDDDDEWMPTYLEEMEINNTENYDVLAGEIIRISNTENSLMALPNNLSEKDFLIGNPGLQGSNTFIKLSMLLKAGAFDESIIATIDRDLFIRVFFLKPKYKVINKKLVIQHTDNDRERLTTNYYVKKKCLNLFFNKYKNFMNEVETEQFLERSKNLFSVTIEDFKLNEQQTTITNVDLDFQKKGEYQFIIGFISADDKIASSLVSQIIQYQVPVDYIVIIDNTPKIENLDNTTKLLNQSQIPYKVFVYEEWSTFLKNGFYGEYFEKYDDINSIPLGRTILHRHLYDESIKFENPVYWIIDDDIDFKAISIDETRFQLFDLINENINRTDAIIGGISNDPPIPALSTIRTQLVDFFHSYETPVNEGCFSINQKPDYYYDLSDLHSDHLETPIPKSEIDERDLHLIFSGKAVSRPALQRELKSEHKTITRRGANTIVLNREVLRLYPVINLEVNHKFARRGDLTWALFNQVLSNKKFIEHTFCINHNRPISKFDLEKELDKSAYDIIGYAFNKSVFKVIEDIKKNPDADVFSVLLTDSKFHELKQIYIYFLQRRKARFLMNYYRIIGLTELIFNKFEVGQAYYEQFQDESKISLFENIIQCATSEIHLKVFLEELKKMVEKRKITKSVLQ
jgi:glycosyltransferase involved in cell wall biosynthesis